MSYEKNNQDDFYKIFKVRQSYGIVYQNIAFLGLIALFLIYRNFGTYIIPIKHLGLMVIASSILITFSFFKFYRSNFTIVWGLFHNLTLGLFIAGLFVWSNDRWSTAPITEEVFTIKKVNMESFYAGRTRSVIKPVIEINIHGRQHKVVFHEQEFKQLMQSRKVKLMLKKGYWGYWIIQDTRILTKTLQ